MSLDLRDLKRLKVTEETHAFLQAQSRITGKSQQEIAREVLHSVAVKRIHEANVLLALAPSKGREGTEI